MFLLQFCRTRSHFWSRHTCLKHCSFKININISYIKLPHFVNKTCFLNEPNVWEISLCAHVCVPYVFFLCGQRTCNTILCFYDSFDALEVNLFCFTFFWIHRICLKIVFKTVAHSKSTLTFHTLNEHILSVKRDFEIS